MKGKVKIQVFKNGLLKEEITKENMITDFAKEILQPAFLPYWNSTSTLKNPYYDYTPIVNNLVGGLLLFNSTRTQSKQHILIKSEDMISYVGSAGGVFTGTTSKVKGTLNVDESKSIETENGEKGYRFVWDFGTGKSFSFKSLSLTSLDAGNLGMDFDRDNDTSPGSLFKSYGSRMNGANASIACKGSNVGTNIPRFGRDAYGDVIYLSDDFKTLILGKLSNNNYILTKFNYKDSIGLMDNLGFADTSDYVDITFYKNWIKESTNTITPATNILDSINKVKWDENYIYSYYTSYTGTTLNIQSTKISVIDFSITEDSFSVEVPKSLNNSIRYYIIVNNNLIINDNYNACIYVINLESKTLTKTINYNKISDTIIQKLNEGVIMLIPISSNPLFAILIDIVSGRVAYNKLSGFTTSNMLVSPYINLVKQVGNSPIFITKTLQNTHTYMNYNIFTCYLASILNLDGDGVSKAEDETLKITYEITNS